MTNRLAWGPLILALIATIWLASLVAPMASIIMWSIILAVLFAKTNKRLTAKFGSKNKGALGTIGLIFLVAVMPFVLLTLVTSAQIVEIIANSGEIAAKAAELSQEFVAGLPVGLQNSITELTSSVDFSPGQIASVIQPALSYSLTVGSNVGIFFASLLGILYVSFFFLRDHDQILNFVWAAVPLNETQKARLSDRLENTISATVRGVIMVAAAQSLIAGVIYALLGLKFFAVLTVLTFIACLIPAIGSALVWIPVAIFFFLNGEPTKGFIMLASGTFVIAAIDNILRPRLIGEKAALPDFMIFLSSIGGVTAIGFNGLFLGPIVAGLFVQCWRLYTEAEGLTQASEHKSDQAESDHQPESDQAGRDQAKPSPDT